MKFKSVPEKYALTVPPYKYLRQLVKQLCEKITLTKQGDETGRTKVKTAHRNKPRSGRGQFTDRAEPFEACEHKCKNPTEYEH
jgi:hypothetical protein